MRYKLLGKSGLRVSELCLGTMTFGEDWGWGTPEGESRRIFDAFVAAGGNFIDTANVYTMGTSERFLGKFLEGKRDRLVLATKYTSTLETGDPNAGGNHRKSMMRAVEASLRRLNTDHIDLYWLHIWDAVTPIEEVMRGFEDLVRQGKVLHAGISDAPAWIVACGNTLAELRGWTPFVGLQIEYSLAERTPERELLPMARALDIAVTPWGVLKSGVLTGKYNDRPPKKSDAASAERRLDSSMSSGFVTMDHRKRVIAETVVTVAAEIGQTPSQVALAWLRYQPGVTIPIIGARRMSQLEDNLGCLEVTLSSEHLARLDEISRIELGFPHEFYENDLIKDMVFAGTRDRVDAHRAVPRE